MTPGVGFAAVHWLELPTLMLTQQKYWSFRSSGGGGVCVGGGGAVLWPLKVWRTSNRLRRWKSALKTSSGNQSASFPFSSPPPEKLITITVDWLSACHRWYILQPTRWSNGTVVILKSVWRQRFSPVTKCSIYFTEAESCIATECLGSQP